MFRSVIFSLPSFPFFLIHLFIYLFLAVLGPRGCVRAFSSCCMWAFSSCSERGLLFSCGVWASHHGGFSCCAARALGVWASVVVTRGLSSCGMRAQLLRGMWDPPRPGLEPVSPALAGGFPTTAPPGKPFFSNIYI